MKRILFFAASLMMTAALASAQEAFSHLSVGIEAGTTGIGADIAVPLVSNRVVLKAGYNFLSFDYTYNGQVNTTEVNSAIRNANDFLASINAPERINGSLNKVNYTAVPKANLGSLKLLVEYYPMAKSSFHVTAGVFYGVGGDLVTGNVQTEEQSWAMYNSIKSQITDIHNTYSGHPRFSQYDVEIPGTIDFNVGKRTFRINEVNGRGNLDFALQVAKLRPYFGFGFGRSIPDSRFGFQADLGVWYHGVPSLTSPNEVAYDVSAESIVDDISVINKAVVYPRLSFSLIYRIL